MPFIPPPNHPCIKVVGSFEELAATPFANGVNALCWPRVLAGDFGEVVTKLGAGEGIVPLDEDRLTGLALGHAGRAARDILLADLRLLRDRGLAPELNCIHAYPRDEATATVPTDVYSYHADRAPIEAATWLCTYHGAASEGLPNEDARRRVDDPATRAKLLREYGGADDAGFTEFLRENCYDLHYAPCPGAQPYPFGLFHLWRIAVAWPGSPVPPCIHRAPAQPPGYPPRLLLISCASFPAFPKLAPDGFGGRVPAVSNAKTEAVELIKKLPDTATLEDIQHHLYVLEKIKQGQNRLVQEGGIPQAGMEKEMARWTLS